MRAPGLCDEAPAGNEAASEVTRLRGELQQAREERRRVEAALELSLSKYERAFRGNPSAITISTVEEGRFLEVNDTCA